MSLLDPLIASLRTRLTKLERNQLTPREGIVTQNMPMMVKLDGDTVSTPTRPMVSAGEGMRVLCIKVGFRWYAVSSLTSQAVAGRRYAADSPIPVPANTVYRHPGFGSPDAPQTTVSGGVEAVSNYGLRVPIDGWYAAGCGVRWRSYSGGDLAQCRLYADDSMIAANNMAAGSTDVLNAVVPAVYLEAGSVINMRVHTTIARDTTHAGDFANSTFISVAKVG